MIIERPTEIYSHFRIPGIVLTKENTLIAYYECRKSMSDWADIDIKIIRSTDAGESWQTVDIIEGNGNTLNNSMMIVKDDEIHFLFHKNYKQLFHSKSTDDGKSFTDAIDISSTFDDCGFFFNAVAIGPGHGIVHKGKMIVPLWFAQNKDVPQAHRPSIISTLYSEDGNEWHLGEFIGKDFLINPSECALAVTKDNKVIISIRNETGHHQRAIATSDNGFEHWEDLHFSPLLPDPTCMGSMCYENGMIYHINCESTEKRENLTVKISEDNFQTFNKILIDEIGGYSDIAVRDNKLYIIYEKDTFNTGKLYFKKF